MQAVPRLLALLCILCVFIPSFIMTGPVRALFVPLSLAVGGAMITSYLLSSTFVPVLSVWLLENRQMTIDAQAMERFRVGDLRETHDLQLLKNQLQSLIRPV